MLMDGVIRPYHFIPLAKNKVSNIAKALGHSMNLFLKNT